jgi:hypothetical protein
MPGVAASDVWQTLAGDIKEKVVIQVAEHLASLFALRFNKAGSLYCISSPGCSDRTADEAGKFEVGPIVSIPFYRSLDGFDDYPSTDLHVPGSPLTTELHSFRGPFTNTGDFLAHYLRALSFKVEKCPEETLQALMVDCEVETLSENPVAELRLKREWAQEISQKAQNVLKKAVELCDYYSDDPPVGLDIPPPSELPFTLCLDDFRLNNILVCTILHGRCPHLFC